MTYLSGTYKGKVVENEANKAALAGANGGNPLVKAMLCKYYNPANHYEEKRSNGCELKFDVIHERHHRQRYNESCGNLIPSAMPNSR
jgi:hypothetical protein